MYTHIAIKTDSTHHIYILFHTYACIYVAATIKTKKIAIGE